MERWKVPTERTETKHGWHDGINEKQHRPRDLDLKILMPSLFSWKRIVLAWHLYIVLMVQSRTNDNAWDRNLIRKIWRRRRRRRNAALDQQGEQITASHFKGSKVELKKNTIFLYIFVIVDLSDLSRWVSVTPELQTVRTWWNVLGIKLLASILKRSFKFRDVILQPRIVRQTTKIKQLKSNLCKCLIKVRVMF